MVVNGCNFFALTVFAQVRLLRAHARQTNREDNAMNVLIYMNERDFERLTETSMLWADYADWPKKRDRFETEAGEDLSFEWKNAYWVGCSGTAVILAKSYLATMGHDYQILWDLASHDNGESFGWVVLTNYQTDTR